MDEVFNKNALKPGDRGFEYDKRIEFKGEEVSDNSWDDEYDSYEDDFDDSNQF
jgi:hypothetical protein